MKHAVLLLLAVVFFGSSPALGCGPFWADTYLTDGNEISVVELPDSRFSQEIARLLGRKDEDDFPRPYNQPQKETLWPWDWTLLADTAQLSESLASKGMSDTELSQTVSLYREIRQAMHEKPNYENLGAQLNTVERFSVKEYRPLLAKLPREFALYVRGAASYRPYEYTSATLYWKELLALPPAERKYRTVWAAYMSGKAFLQVDSAQAIQWFEKTREFVKEGFPDPLDLGGQSIGWQARAEKDLGRYAEAIHHYIEMAKTDASHNNEASSLLYTCRKAMSEGKVPFRYRDDPLARRVILTYVICHGTLEEFTTSEQQMREIAKSLEVGETDLLACRCYREGDLVGARFWLDNAKDHGLPGKWVEAKLLLVDGKIDEALALLRTLMTAFPQNEDWFNNGAPDTSRPSELIRGEIGVLILGRKDYVSAMDLFIKGGFMDDASYIAERVLTTDELENYIKSALDEKDKEYLEGNRHEPLDRARLSDILARRLARSGKLEKARNYCLPKVRPIFDQYAGHMKVARDTGKPKRERALAYYRAAKITRENGMEILGSENEPDWSSYSGSYERSLGGSHYRLHPDFTVSREPYGWETSAPVQWIDPKLKKALSASEDEKRRISKPATNPDKRWHYRYTASDLMWECAKLSPDNDPLTVAALYHGGYWHRGTDHDVAQKFYNAMVRRCSKTEIGKRAAVAGWWFSSELLPEPVE